VKNVKSIYLRCNLKIVGNFVPISFEIAESFESVNFVPPKIFLKGNYFLVIISGRTMAPCEVGTKYVGPLEQNHC